MITQLNNLITDYILAIACFILAYRLNRRISGISFRYYTGAFIGVGLAAFFGGTSHGFHLYFSDLLNILIWKLTLYSVATATTLLLLGGACSTFNKQSSNYKIMSAFTLLKFIIFLILITLSDNFLLVALDYAITFVVFLSVRYYAFSLTGDPGYKWFLYGMAMAIIMAVVWFTEFSLYQYFNEDDIAHIIQIGVMYCFYRGVMLSSFLET